MARVTPVRFTGVLLLCRFVAVFDFEPPVGGAAYVARLWPGMTGGEQSSYPAVVGHAIFAPSVLAALPLDSVIVLIDWLGCGALGACLHLRRPFCLLLSLLFPVFLPRQPQNLQAELLRYAV